MSNTRKIAISLPSHLVREIERIMKKTGETRSAVIRQAIEQSLKQDELDARVKQYIEGYLQHPESDEEKILSRATSGKVFEEEPWE